MDIDREVEAECQSLLDEGVKLMRVGNLKSAIGKFDTVIMKAPLKTAIGGEAVLQKAICLDSLGCNLEAKGMYQQIRT